MESLAESRKVNSNSTFNLFNKFNIFKTRKPKLTPPQEKTKPINLEKEKELLLMSLKQTDWLFTKARETDPGFCATPVFRNGRTLFHGSK